MNEIYRIIYTESAIQDIEEKADYISFELQEPGLAEKWYRRLRNDILKNLTRFPCKYPPCSVEKWRAKGIRQLVLRNDVILYSVDEETLAVYIRLVCTRGKDLSSDWEK